MSRQSGIAYSEKIQMKSKKLVCGAMAAAITLSVAFSGCSLVSTLNEEDMRQTIATVNITTSDNIAKEGLADYTSAIKTANITKRDLIASFVNIGSSYIQSGYSYADVFNMLVDSLTSNEVVSQYATLYLLKEKSAQDSDILETFNSFSTEVEKYEFLLSGETSEGDGEGEGSDRILLAKYDLYSSINSSIDSLEESIIDGEDEETGTDSRTTPANADTLKEDYLPLKDGQLNYGIYTGYEGYLIGDSGIYKDDEIEGSTRETRKRAYSAFIANLKTNYLISEDDDVVDVLSVSYIQDEYLTRLQQQVINEYLERYSKTQEALIDEVVDGEYVFLKDRYETDLAAQEISNDISSFETTMGNLSDTSFILYAPATDETDGGTYGYVYNILLPFSAAQSLYIDSSDTSAEYYFMRKDILADITTTDQRAAWFNGVTDYSFNAAESSLESYYTGSNSGRNYLFFENNLLHSDRYEELDKYAGLYTYNGTVRENADGTYSLSANKLKIDDMLNEFTAYINFVLDKDAASYSFNDDYKVTSPEDYYTAETRDEEDEADRKIDYSRFVYATGKVEFEDKTLGSLFVKGSDQYKALSAVNELQYAYTTDTGVLSEYIGYSVSAFDTSYIPEFEYAAQKAVEEGAGTFYVCAGDYGWHIIYVTATFDVQGGAVMGENVDWAAASVNQDGTFQNLYYNWIKDTTLSNITTNRRTLIIDAFGGSTITLYKDAYSDLLELDA